MVHPTDTEILRQDGAGLYGLISALLEAVERIEQRMDGKRPRRGDLPRKALAVIVTMRAEGRRVTIAAVAEECGTTRGALYRYPTVISAIDASRPGTAPRRGHKSKDGSIEAYDDGECDT